MAKALVNLGHLHAVRCEWCGLKMGCNCLEGNMPDREGHIVVLCPRCQVTDFLNLLFGGKLRREMVLSKFEQSEMKPKQRCGRKQPELKLISRRTDTRAASTPARKIKRGRTFLRLIEVKNI
jgi:hypothetical protein